MKLGCGNRDDGKLGGGKRDDWKLGSGKWDDGRLHGGKMGIGKRGSAKWDEGCGKRGGEREAVRRRATRRWALLRVQWKEGRLDRVNGRRAVKRGGWERGGEKRGGGKRGYELKCK